MVIRLLHSITKRHRDWPRFHRPLRSRTHQARRKDSQAKALQISQMALAELERWLALRPPSPSMAVAVAEVVVVSQVVVFSQPILHT